MISGLSNVNIELTNRCNKSCWMCGRRKIEKDYPDLLREGDMDFSLVELLAKEVPPGVVIQFHNNGEPFLYPRLGDALSLFRDQVKCLDTNGKLLVKRISEIIDNLDTITISVIEKDPEGDEQYEIVREFLSSKGDRKPIPVFRLLGDVPSERWTELGLVAFRTLHDPLGNFGYKKKVVLPEIGICLEVLHHLSINKDGLVSCCVRFDPQGEGVIGDLNKESLEEIWNGRKRALFLSNHLNGLRDVTPLCNRCEYWGVPTG